MPRLLAGVVVLLIGVWLGGHPSWLPSPVRSTFVASDGHDAIIDDVLGLIQRDYYRKVPRSQLVNQGLAAAVASLNDPYSHYYDPTDYQSFQNTDTNPSESGVGVTVDPATRGLMVTAVFRGSPAARAGIVRGDVITAVGTVPLAGHAYNSATNLIRGRPGTFVQLTVQTSAGRRVLRIRRARISVPVTAGKIVDYHGKRIGYVELSQFSQGSGDQVRQQVQKLLHEGAKGLILDLRQNGGGLLNEAVNLASIFIPNGTIVSTDGRALARQVYMAKGDAIATSQPLVVLVDSGTASSSEIVTAALRQRGRAKVVGTHTYGKGVFQEIEPLPNGGALDFTVGEFFTPNGDNLGGGGVKRGRGIQPDIYAYTKPTARVDTALTVAEKTVAGELR